MPAETQALLGLGLAIGVAYTATPIAIRVADRFQFYDHPVGYKGHGKPTPYLGGGAVVFAFLAALLVFTGDWDRTLPLAGGVALLWAIGTVDDRRTVTPVLRVTAEVGLAAGLWALGLGWDLGAGAALDLAVTAVWVVAVVNAFNLFDNMDGAASSMAGVVALGLGILGAIEGDAWLTVAAAALAGACLGFLPHNLVASPARIFLGDGGSMPIGFAVAALTMTGVGDAAPAWQSLAMGVLFVGVPALDTLLVVVSRTRRGVSIMTGGRDHLTHRAKSRLRTARAVAITLGAAQAVVSALALVALQGGSSAIVATVGLYLVAVGAAVAVLDTRLAPEAAAPVPAPAPGTTRRRRLGLEVAAPALLVPIGVVAGLSPFAFGYYSSANWVPAGLVLVAATTALAIARPVRLSGAGRAALAGLGGLGLWALASAGWADSAAQAIVEADRYLVYAVGLGLLLLLVRSDRAGLWLMGAFGTAALVTAGIVVARMLGADGAEVFLGGRLDKPLGYINGEAAFLLLAVWPCLAAAEQRRSAVVAGLGLGAATLLACLLVLSQSRGVALAAFVSVIVVLAAVPGRLHRAWVLVTLSAAVGLAGPWLLEVFQDAGDGTLAAGTVHAAARAALLTSVLAGVAWGVATVAAGELEPRGAGPRRLAAGALAVLVAGGLALGAVNAGSVEHNVRTQYHAFVNLSLGPEGSSLAPASRLVSGAGYRYDYWRVAWGAWLDRPLTGWGAGNYDAPYFERRATSEDIRQPHSVQLQVLSELGLVGAGLLAMLLAAAALGGRAASRAARTSPPARGLAVAAIGTLTAWLVHTSVDWIHLLPGVTAAALAAFAVLVRDRSATNAPAPVPAANRTRALLVAIPVALVLAVAGISLARQAMADHYRAAAQSALAADPGEALVQADRALRLDPQTVSGYYTKAAALARFDKADAARGALLEAARREPRDFVTWALLGDLAVRMGDLDAAKADYARAASLNPRETGLAALARDPEGPR